MTNAHICTEEIQEKQSFVYFSCCYHLVNNINHVYTSQVCVPLNISMDIIIISVKASHHLCQRDCVLGAVGLSVCFWIKQKSDLYESC